MHDHTVESSCLVASAAATVAADTKACGTSSYDQTTLYSTDGSAHLPVKPDKAAHDQLMYKLQQQVGLDRVRMKEIKMLLHSKPIAGHVAAGRIGRSAHEQQLFSIPALKAEREQLRLEIHDLRKQQHIVHSEYKKAWHVYKKYLRVQQQQQRRDRRRPARDAGSLSCDPSCSTSNQLDNSSSGSYRQGHGRRRCPAATVLPAVHPGRPAVQLGHRGRGRHGSSRSTVAHPGATKVATAMSGKALQGFSAEHAAAEHSAGSSCCSEQERLDLAGIVDTAAPAAATAADPATCRHYPAIPGMDYNAADQAVAGGSSGSSTSCSSSAHGMVQRPPSRHVRFSADVTPQQGPVSASTPSAAAAAAAATAAPATLAGACGDGSELTCIICLSAPRSVLLLPCKHLVLCENCAHDLQNIPAAPTARSRSRRSRRRNRRDAGAVTGAAIPSTVVRVLWRVWFGRGRGGDESSDADSVLSEVSISSHNRGQEEGRAVCCPVCRVPVEQQMLVFT